MKERRTTAKMQPRRATRGSKKQYVFPISISFVNLADCELQNFASDGVILTGIVGNDSTVTFHNIESTGGKQWVSFYYQNTDDMGFGDQRKLRPILIPLKSC